MINIDLGAIVFTRGFSLKHTAGKQITVGELIEKRIFMMTSKAMIMYIGVTSEKGRPIPSCLYYYYSTHRPLSNMHLEY